MWSPPQLKGVQSCSSTILSNTLINFSTSSAGSIRLEIQDVEGKRLPGFELGNCPELFGDEIDRTVEWKGGPSVAALAGKTVRLRFVMKDADLYSLKFNTNE